MRTTRTLAMATAALLVTSPAVAQNTSDANATDDAATNAADANTTVTDPAAVSAETAPAPAPAEKGFPWGVIGLLGLLGLIPRTRRG